MSRLDLIKESLITVRLDRKDVWKANLPQILEKLARGEDLEFPALRIHQQHPWYAFLVQLASLAIHNSGQVFQSASAEQWEEWLLHLAGGRREAFCLIVEDVSMPAFFQPPVPEGDLAQFKKEFFTPDELDVLVTAKNHDVKAVKMERSRPEHWAFSLMTLQTMEGFLGAGNYGIVRMNGGFASRPFVSYALSLGWGSRFCRDTKILISAREDMINSHGYQELDGKTLLWLEPWDGKSSLELQECDPFFIESCRRVRLLARGDNLSAVSRSTSAARVAQGNRKGDTGDPWTPVEKGDEPKALNISLGGFGYDLVHKLICSNDFEVGATQRLSPGDPENMLFVASALARKQGGTEGFHERVIAIPPNVRLMLGIRRGREQLEEIAKQRVSDVGKWKRDVLRFALCALAQGKSKDLDLSDQRAKPILRRFDAQVDRIFFRELWADSEISRERAAIRWNKILMELAKTELEYASDSMGIPSDAGYRNRAFASIVFGGRAKQTFPDLFPPQEEKEDE